MRGECSNEIGLSASGYCSKEQSQPRDTDPNPGMWMTSYSPRTGSMTHFVAAATGTCSRYSPLFTDFRRAARCGLSPSQTKPNAALYFQRAGKLGVPTVGCGSNPP